MKIKDLILNLQKFNPEMRVLSDVGHKLEDVVEITNVMAGDTNEEAVVIVPKLEGNKIEPSSEGNKELKWKSEMLEWGEIYHPDLEKNVMTYYPKGLAPYDTVTNPFMDKDGDVYYYKFDQDERCWKDEMIMICNSGEYEDVEEVLFY